MFNLDGQIALVTGGSQGIGRETALTLARLGADVAIMARSADRCEAVASEIRDLGRRAVALPGDMSKSDEIRSVVEKAVSSHRDQPDWCLRYDPAGPAADDPGASWPDHQSDIRCRPIG
jgi:NAD(P)-dependent dehydrogenase (short-subunit alcohol dehydrogenase family)